jgi:hypothetical protein
MKQLLDFARRVYICENITILAPIPVVGTSGFERTRIDQFRTIGELVAITVSLMVWLFALSPVILQSIIDGPSTVQFPDIVATLLPSRVTRHGPRTGALVISFSELSCFMAGESSLCLPRLLSRSLWE